jgi:D-3-phosphoglycerate dehydrogenase
MKPQPGDTGMTAQPTPFRVAYFDKPMYPSFLQALEGAPGIETVCLDFDQPREQALTALASCQGYYVMASRDELPWRWHVTAELLQRLPGLRLVSSYGAGYDTVDVAACTAAGVGVVSQAGGNAQAVAEHAVAMMLSLLKRIPETQHAMLAGAAGNRSVFLGRELTGRTVGIVGIGHTGSRAAAILNKAFGCRVLACDPYVDAAACAARGAEKTDLDGLLRQSDIVDLHCPLSDETRGMMGAAQFAKMPRGALLVNTARGGICDEDALYQALCGGHLAGAGIDVWAQEPPPVDHPLLRHPSVVVSQHTAGVTHESRDRVARMAAQSFIDFAAGKTPAGLVNPEVMQNYGERFQQEQRPPPGP